MNAKQLSSAEKWHEICLAPSEPSPEQQTGVEMNQDKDRLENAIGGRERAEIYRRFAPAYSYGWRECLRRGRGAFDDVEQDLRAGWREVIKAEEISWEEARGAVRAGWNHVSH